MTLILAVLAVIVIFLVAWLFAPQGWRTVVFNALAALPVIGLPLTDALSGFDWTALFDKAEAAAFALGVTVCNTILRTITTTPLGKKPE